MVEGIGFRVYVYIYMNIHKYIHVFMVLWVYK